MTKTTSKRALHLRELRELVTAEAVEQAYGRPFAETHHQCHAVSLAIVKAGLIPGARVARGSARGVGAQHSWVVCDHDPYNEQALIVDATLWSYRDDVNGVLVTHNIGGGYRHTPHGYGSIWDWGKPCSTGGAEVDLDPAAEDRLSMSARRFLDLVLPLDRRGWMRLAQAPVGGWPAAEIITAMDDTPALRAFVPIDILGMLTDRNPSGLYLPGEGAGDAGDD